MSDLLQLGPSWEPTKVPPLRVDIDQRRRALRRALAAELRTWALIGAGLAGTATGAIVALCTCTGALA